MYIPRSPKQTESNAIAELWWRSWHDAHADIVPVELVELRTNESFLARTRDNIDLIRVTGSIGEPVGMCQVEGNEMKQLFVSDIARGSGAALSLLTDAECTMKDAGIKTAWLACAIGNSRAERFYTKCGWNNVGKIIENLATQNGIFKLETWRFEKEF